AKLVVFPIRSDWLPRLRRDLAGAGGDPTARPGLPEQTRIDDLYFDRHARLRAVGLCINQGAYVARTNPAANPADDPLARIAQAIRDRLKAYPLPGGIDPDGIARLQADIAFQENPVRPLQRLANQSPQLD